jgi:hypothetical protein
MIPTMSSIQQYYTQEFITLFITTPSLTFIILIHKFETSHFSTGEKYYKIYFVIKLIDIHNLSSFFFFFFFFFQMRDYSIQRENNNLIL